MSQSPRTISAAALSRATFPGIFLPDVWGELLGEPAPDAQILVWGEPGSGKSTWALGLTSVWARHVGPALYVAAEEGVSKSLADRARRLGATSPRLSFAVYDPAVGLDGTMEDVRRSGASMVVLDSLTWVDPYSHAFGEFAQALRDAGVFLVFVAHAVKGGKRSRGRADVAHAVDAVVHVAGGTASTTKNRFAPLTSTEVPFEANRANPSPSCDCQACTDCGGVRRSNPSHNGACAYAKKHVCECSCGGRLHGSAITRVQGDRGTRGRQTPQGRAVMAGLTESGRKKVKGRPTAPKGKAKPKRSGSAPSAPKRPAPKKASGGGVMAQIVALKKQIGSL